MYGNLSRFFKTLNLWQSQWVPAVKHYGRYKTHHNHPSLNRISTGNQNIQYNMNITEILYNGHSLFKKLSGHVRDV